jgi:hypothetical protein
MVILVRREIGEIIANKRIWGYDIVQMPYAAHKVY